MSTATTPTSGTVTPERLAAARKAVISSSLGAALEWFDVIVYASFAVVIAHNFFPGGDNTLGLILTFATFAISYVIRPLGGMVLGSYADRRGRKNALTLTMMLMMIGTLIMAVAPTTSMIGPWAGVVILVSRLIQGFSAGGEFGTATTFLVETAPHKKAFYSSCKLPAKVPRFSWHRCSDTCSTLTFRMKRSTRGAGAFRSSSASSSGRSDSTSVPSLTKRTISRRVFRKRLR